MHRNTYLLVSVLAVIAALVIGVNMGRRVVQPQEVPLPSSPTATTRPSPRSYRNEFCKVTFDYRDGLTLLENASGSAAFTGPSAEDGILLTCQKDIPRPAGEGEAVRIGTVAATLYHDSVDTLIFRHPGTKLDVLLAGTRETLKNILATLKIL